MASLGKIVPSTSSWNSPIVCAKKKNGAVWVCLDYCKLNALAHAEPYQMPRVDDLLNRLGRARYLSTLALTKEHYHISEEGRLG